MTAGQPLVILVHGTDVGVWPKRLRDAWWVRLLLVGLAVGFGLVVWTTWDDGRWGRPFLAGVLAALLTYLAVSRKAAMPNAHEWIHLGEPIAHECRPNSGGEKLLAAEPSPSNVLKEELGRITPEPRFLAFSWSGMNSTKHRLQAARCLAKELEERLRDTTGPLFVVAHSHGGNVALYARDCLTAHRDRVNVIALSTPFIRVFRSKIREFFLALVLFTLGLSLLVLRASDTDALRVAAFVFAAMAGIWMAISWIGWITYAANPFFRSAERRYGHRGASWVSSIAFIAALAFLLAQLAVSVENTASTGSRIAADLAMVATTAALVGAASALVFARLRRNRAWTQRDDIVCRAKASVASSAIERIGSVLDVKEVEPNTTVVIRTVGDEAEGVLVTSQFIAWSAGRKLVDLVTPDAASVESGDNRTTEPSEGWKWGSFVASIVLVAAAFAAVSESTAFWEGPVFAILLLGTIRLLGATVLWVTTGLALGWTHAPLIWFFGTSAEALPYGEPTVHQLSVASTTDPNLHSSWRNPRAAELVRKAIEQRL